ncbi:MAG: ribonuclease P protein component [Oligoflexales bacterium]|nr:ribonuclease P protein component [Oligoflexales bacterium]
MFNFPKTSRLLKQLEFNAVFQSEAKVVDPYFVMLGVRSSRSVARIGVVASRKVGNAVTRNGIKRRIRERFRLIKKDGTGIDFVVVARSQAVFATTEDLSVSFDRCLDRLYKKIRV